jgi:uncharacterized protein YkwD
MRRAVRILFLLIMIAIASCVPAYWGDASGYADPVDPSEIFTQVNRERQDNNLPPLAWDDGLSIIAQNHAEDMAGKNYFSHTGPDGRDAFDYLTEAGITYRCAAENIAWGDDNARTLVKRWMGSSGHRKNILGDFSKVGIGSYRRYYVLLLVRQ